MRLFMGRTFYNGSVKMSEKPKKKKTSFWGQPFDLNRNGKIDPTEAALIMMVIDDCERDNTEVKAINNQIIDIEDMDIEGI